MKARSIRGTVVFNQLSHNSHSHHKHRFALWRFIDTTKSSKPTNGKIFRDGICCNQYALMKIYTRKKKRIGPPNVGFDWPRFDPSTMGGNCKWSAVPDWLQVISVMRRIRPSPYLIFDAFSLFSILSSYMYLSSVRFTSRTGRDHANSMRLQQKLSLLIHKFLSASVSSRDSVAI